jgi:hypothetical protein
MSFVVTLVDYTPPPRYSPVVTPWTQARIGYATTQAGPFANIDLIALSPLDGNAATPQVRNLTTLSSPAPTGWFQVTWLDALGNQAPTDPVSFPPGATLGAASPSQLSARYAVRHRIRDGVPLTDANPVPYNMVRLEDLSDQVPAVPTPVQATFQCRYADIPTGRYMNAAVVPGTLVAFVDGSWTPISPIADVDQNGNFTLPVPPVASLRITYAWQYLSDGEIDQFVDESRQWLREFTAVTGVPDGLVPALVSYAASRALSALARSATLAPVKAGDSDVDWSKLAAAYQAEAAVQYKTANDERTAYYSMGPEGLDPTVVDFSSLGFGTYTPER